MPESQTEQAGEDQLVTLLADARLTVHRSVFAARDDVAPVVAEAGADLRTAVWPDRSVSINCGYIANANLRGILVSSVLGLNVLVRDVVQAHARVVAGDQESLTSRRGEWEGDHTGDLAALGVLAPGRLGGKLSVVAESLHFEEHLGSSSQISAGSAFPERNDSRKFRRSYRRWQVCRRE